MSGPSQSPSWTPGKRLFAAVVRAFLRSVSRVRVSGLEHVPTSGPLVVVANHASNSDPAFVGGWLQPALRRPIEFLAKEQLFRWPLSTILRAHGGILVRAGGQDTQAYRAGRRVLERGGVLGLFPEGRRSRDGTLQQAIQGVTLLAARSGAPVLPVALSGTHSLLPPGRYVPRFGTRVTMRVGEPFPVELDAALPRREALDVATAELMRRIARLLPETQHGRYRGS